MLIRLGDKMPATVGGSGTGPARRPGRPAGSGVSRCRVFRPLDDPNYVLIDLDFNRSAEAEAFLESLRTVWSQVELSPALRRDSGDDNDRPRARIVEQVESNHCS